MFKSIASFFSSHKVFVAGLASAVALAIQQYVGKVIDWKVIGLAVLIAAASYLGKNLTGVGASISGIVGSALITISQAGSAPVSWNTIVLSLVAGALGILAGAATPKPPVSPSS